MRVQRFALKNATRFQDVTFHFESDPLKGSVSLLVGEQYSGKTTALKNLFNALTWFSARYKDSRSAGLVMPDADIRQQSMQSCITIEVGFAEELAAQKAEDAAEEISDSCQWSLIKTLKASKQTGISSVQTEQLEQLVARYQQLFNPTHKIGLPLICYYPAERFVHDVPLQAKNSLNQNMLIHAYDYAPIPYTTFHKFFEWMKELTEIENARLSQVYRQYLHPNQRFQLSEVESLIPQLEQSYRLAHSPYLAALTKAVHAALPHIHDLYIEYEPKLQLCVDLGERVVNFTQLSQSDKSAIALVGDVVRRLCSLNPFSLYPCEEGDGIILIDEIELYLSPARAEQFLAGLHQAFPRCQIIASSRFVLDEFQNDFQYIQLQHGKADSIDVKQHQQDMAQLLEQLQQNEPLTDLADEQLPVQDADQIDDIWQQIQQLSESQQQQLRLRWQSPDLSNDMPTSPHRE